MIYLAPLAVWNVIVAAVYGIDKFKAKRGLRRISEKCLLILAFLMGGQGALMGMVLFNHKTSKRSFRLMVPLMTLLNMAVILFFKYRFLR